MPFFSDNPRFDQISLRQIADSYGPRSNGSIALPGFQRNAVWKEGKVQDLWDSILSRFPIGAIMLARTDEFAAAGTRPVQISRSSPMPDMLSDSSEIEYIVVDGQQRLNAIAIGFMPYAPKMPARLWIDLLGGDPKTGCTYGFYLCTRQNPFGAGLSKAEQREALRSIQREGVADEDLELNETYPFMCKLKQPVPFFEFCSLCKPDSNWERILTGLMDRNTLQLEEPVFNLLKDHLKQVSRQSEDFAHQLNNVLEGGYRVPAILVRKEDGVSSPEKLGKLFERVNIGGEVPPQAELFFSALKLRFPIINDYIAAAHNDLEIGGLQKPTDLVLAALRILDPTITGLNLDQFERITNQHGENLIELIRSNSDRESRFLACLKMSYKALHHNGSISDYGLPRQFLARIRPRVWQTLAYWINRNYSDVMRNGITDNDRFAMVRYAVLDSFSYFFNVVRPQDARREGDAPKYSRAATDACQEKVVFDLDEILRNITQQAPYQLIILRPEKYREKFEHEDSSSINYWLSGDGYLPLYSQRFFLSNPEWERCELDVDHIIPQAWFNFKAGRNGLFALWQVEGIDYWNRFPVLNSVGNQRLWPEALNRSYGGASPKNKWIHSDVEELIPGYEHTRFGLIKVKDVLSASFITYTQANAWADLERAEDYRIWDNFRFRAFKEVVDKRRYQMYKELFTVLRFGDLTEWLIEEPVPSA